MLTLNDPKINPADFVQVEFRNPQGMRKEKVFVPHCRIMPEYRDAFKHGTYEHVDMPEEVYAKFKHKI